LELRIPDTKTARWIYPFADDPEAGLFMRRLSEAETNRIFDRNGYFPGAAKGQTMDKVTKVHHEIVNMSIEDWKGIKLNGQDLPCTQANKETFLTALMRNADGERVGIWTIVNDAFDATLEEDLKN
jgi:hypothetical protein